jgi:hypothetical protein
MQSSQQPTFRFGDIEYKKEGEKYIGRGREEELRG